MECVTAAMREDLPAATTPPHLLSHIPSLPLATLLAFSDTGTHPDTAALVFVPGAEGHPEEPWPETDRPLATDRPFRVDTDKGDTAISHAGAYKL
jgi:hypothetical protein